MAINFGNLKAKLSTGKDASKVRIKNGQEIWLMPVFYNSSRRARLAFAKAEMDMEYDISDPQLKIDSDGLNTYIYEYKEPYPIYPASGVYVKYIKWVEE